MKWLSLSADEKKWYRDNYPIDGQANPYDKCYERSWNKLYRKEQKTYKNRMKDDLKTRKELGTRLTYKDILEYAGKTKVADWTYEYLSIRKQYGSSAEMVGKMSTYICFRFQNEDKKPTIQ